MSFLCELQTLQKRAIEDLKSEETQKGILAFQQYVLDSLKTLKDGIYNEFRKQVLQTPTHQQYVVFRTLYPSTDETVLGLLKTLDYTPEMDTLLTRIRAEFTEFCVGVKNTLSYKKAKCWHSYYDNCFNCNKKERVGLCFIFTVHLDPN